MVSMTSRQIGHFFFERRVMTRKRRHSRIQRGGQGRLQFRRKVVLLSIWAFAPLPLYFSEFFGMISPWKARFGLSIRSGCAGCYRGCGVILQSIQLFFIKDLQTGLVCAIKILTGSGSTTSNFIQGALLFAGAARWRNR